MEEIQSGRTEKITKEWKERKETKGDKNNIVFDLFHQRVLQDPDARAILDQDGWISYQDLEDRAMILAALIPDECRRAGIVMSHGKDQIACMLACLYKGVAYVPVEPDFPAKRMAFMLSESECSMIFSDKRKLPVDTDVQILSVQDILCRKLPLACNPMDCQAKAEDEAYILYTSGSTGKPKGVIVTNHNICHYVRAFQHEFHQGPGDIMLQYSVCSFDIFTEEVYTTLLYGAALCIVDWKIREDPEKVLEYAGKYGVTIISGFPYLLQKFNDLPERIPSSIRLLISGGDVLRADYVNRIPSSVLVYNTYGPSETTVCASYYNCTGKPGLEDGTYPIGKPVLETDILITDEKGNELPSLEKGEIVILGEGISNGYCDRKNPENAAFKMLEDGRKAYFSGDLGMKLEDGNLAFFHRKDRQIMIEGKRVEPDEVERVLANCPGIHQAVVVAETDENNLSYMSAYIVLEDQSLSLSAIKAFMKKELTPFMIPEFFVRLEEIPVTENGKPDHSRLPKILK